MTRYICCDERRRNAIAGLAGINGLDFLEVRDDPADPLPDRQRTLFAHFINDPSGLVLGPGNVRIEGGERIRDIRVASAAIAVDARSGSARPVLVVQVEAAGDFSIYTLRLVEDAAQAGRLATIDPILRAVDFSFKVACDSGFDASAAACAPARLASPMLDYTARDFRALRQMLLDRAATLSPEWTPISASRCWSCSLMSATTSPTGRMRWRRKRIWTRRGGAFPSGAMRGWWITACMMVAPPACSRMWPSKAASLPCRPAPSC
jgi:hypothetical protein